MYDALAAGQHASGAVLLVAAEPSPTGGRYGLLVLLACLLDT